MSTNRVPPPRVAEFDAERVRDISEMVYRDRLSAEDLASMIAKQGEAYVRRNAGCYDVMTRAYMRALGVS
jgi:hypothetical protein